MHCYEVTYYCFDKIIFVKMNTPSQSIIMNSYQYTPVYFIQNPTANQVSFIRATVVTETNEKL